MALGKFRIFGLNDTYTDTKFSYTKIQNIAKLYGCQQRLQYFVMMFFFNLVSHANDPLSHHAARLHETIEQDKPIFCAMVVERSEVLRHM